MYTLYNVQEKVRAYTHTGGGIKCDAKGAVSLAGHRDIWLQIYCRGLVGFLSCFYDSIPHSPQAVLSLTFTSSDPLGLLLLLYVSYKGGGYFI